MARYNLTASDAAELIGRVNGTGGYSRLEPGDLVILAAGTYDCTAAPLDFPHGVYVIGAGRGATIIDGQLDTDLLGKPLPLVLDGLTIDATGLAAVGTFGSNEVKDGLLRLIDVEIIGSTATGAGNCITFISQSASFRCAAISCVFTAAERDVVSLKAPSGGSIAANSILQLFSCIGHNAGVNVNDQVLTPHNGATIEDFGGYYYDANGGQTMASDAPATSPLRLYGTRMRHDGGYGIAAGVTSADGMDVSRSGGLMHDFQVYESLTNSYLERMEVIPRGTAVVTIDNNEIFGGGVHVETAGAQARIVRNLIQDYAVANVGGIWIDALANGIYRIEGNIVRGCTRNYYFRNEGSPTIVFRDNLGFLPGSATVFVFGSTGSITLSGGYNHLHGTFTSYSAQTGDVTTEPTPNDVRTWRQSQGRLYRRQMLSQIRVVSELMKSQWRNEWDLGVIGVAASNAATAATQATAAAADIATNEALLQSIKAKTDIIGTQSEITVTTPVIPTKWRVFAFSRVTNEPVLGDAANITAKLAIDHAGPVALTDVNPVEIEDGYYYFDLSTAEQTGAVFELFPESATTGVQVIGVPGRMESNATLRAIESKTDLLGTGQASVDAPVLYSGSLRTLVLGDDYKAVNNRALVWNVTTSIVVASCRLSFYQSDDRQMTVTGTQVNDAGVATLTFDIDEADWLPMTEGDAEYNVEARDSAGNEITFIHSYIGSRKVRLIRKYT